MGIWPGLGGRLGSRQQAMGTMVGRQRSEGETPLQALGAHPGTVRGFRAGSPNLRGADPAAPGALRGHGLGGGSEPQD